MVDCGVGGGTDFIVKAVVRGETGAGRRRRIARARKRRQKKKEEEEGGGGGRRSQKKKEEGGGRGRRRRQLEEKSVAGRVFNGPSLTFDPSRLTRRRRHENGVSLLRGGSTSERASARARAREREREREAKGGWRGCGELARSVGGRNGLFVTSRDSIGSGFHPRPSTESISRDLKPRQRELSETFLSKVSKKRDGRAPWCRRTSATGERNVDALACSTMRAREEKKTHQKKNLTWAELAAQSSREQARSDAVAALLERFIENATGVR